MEKNFGCLLRYFCILFFFCLPDEAKTQVLTKYIVVDQFGYLPSSKKIAVIRDPQTGFDAADSFTPGTQYALIDKATGNAVFTAASVFETENFDFEIFPNPSSGLIRIESKKPGAYDVEVVNSLGTRITSSHQSQSITIDVGHQPQGSFYYHYQPRLGNAR